MTTHNSPGAYHAELQKKYELYSLPNVEGATAHVAEGKSAGHYKLINGKWALVQDKQSPPLGALDPFK